MDTGESDIFQQLLEAAPDAIVIMGMDQGIRFINRAAEKMFGYHRDELVGQSLSILLPERFRAVHLQHIANYMQQPSRRPMGATRALAALRRDGTEFPADISLSPLQIQGHALVTASVRDITDYTEVLTELEEQKRRLERKTAEFAALAQTDSLTGLLNRRAFGKYLSWATDRALRNGTMVAVLFLDLDKFKPINDQLGHTTGDQVLCQIAERVLRAVRKVDRVARIGGDEFAVLLEDVKRRQDVIRVVEVLVKTISEPYRIQNYEAELGVSIGIALLPLDADNPEALMDAADSAMYLAKNAPDRYYAFYKAPG